MKLLLNNCYLYRDKEFDCYSIAIDDGIIISISRFIPPSGFDRVFEFNNFTILPGFADVHVHFREPGFSYKETVKTGSLAAAHGGYTAVCTMPNLNPVPDSSVNLKLQVDLIKKDAVIPVYPLAAITKGQMGEGELVDFEALKDQAIAFSDDGRGVQSEALMLEAMKYVKSVDGLIAAHCEDNTLLNGGYIHDGIYATNHGHKGICSKSEWGQIERDIELVRKTGCRYHVCHISTKESVELIRKAKKEGLPITCETGPHYLALCEDDLQEDGRFKMNPPLRSAIDKAALLEGISDGTIDVIATDHAPHSVEEKSEGLAGSAMGVVGLETAFSVCYTVLVKSGLITLPKLIELLSTNPRRIFRLPTAEIEVGQNANFTVVDLNSEQTINPNTFFSLGRSTPFQGYKAYGEIKLTIIDGRIVWQA